MRRLYPLGASWPACRRVRVCSRLGDAASAGHDSHRRECRDHFGVGQREEQQASGAEEVEDEHDRRDERRWEAELRVA